MKSLKLDLAQIIVILLALLHTFNGTYRKEALNILKERLKEVYTVSKAINIPTYAIHRLFVLMFESRDFVFLLYFTIVG